MSVKAGAGLSKKILYRAEPETLEMERIKVISTPRLIFYTMIRLVFFAYSLLFFQPLEGFVEGLIIRQEVNLAQHPA